MDERRFTRMRSYDAGSFVVEVQLQRLLLLLPRVPAVKFGFSLCTFRVSSPQIVYQNVDVQVIAVEGHGFIDL